ACRQLAVDGSRLRCYLLLGLKPAAGVEPGVPTIPPHNPRNVQQLHRLLRSRLGDARIQIRDQRRGCRSDQRFEAAEQGLRRVEKGLLYHARTELGTRRSPETAQLLDERIDA